MYAAIMGGMNAQRKENTANRRDNTRLFAEYVKNQREQGIDLTEQGMSDQWNNNAVGVGLARGNAPTKDRMRSIMDAQSKSNAQKDKAQQFKDFQNDLQVKAAMQEQTNNWFRDNPYKEDGGGEGFRALHAQLGEGSLLGDALGEYTDNGINFGSLHKQYNAGQLVSNLPAVTSLANSGMPIEEIAQIMPSVPDSVLKQAFKTAQAGQEKIAAQNEQALLVQGQTNFTGAAAALQEIAKIRPLAEGEAEILFQKFGVIDPEIQKSILSTVEATDERRINLDIDTNNAKTQKRLDQGNADIATQIAQLRKDYKETFLANFTEFPDNIQGPLNAISDEYVLNSDQANNLSTYLATKQEEWAGLNKTEIKNEISNHLKEKGVQTYVAKEIELQDQLQEKAGMITYQPSKFKSIYMEGFDYNMGGLMDTLKQASESSNSIGFDRTKSVIVALLMRTRNDLSRRQANQKQSFGSSVNNEDAGALILEMQEKIKTYTTQLEQMKAPKKTEKVVEVKVDTIYTPMTTNPSSIQNLKEAFEVIDGMLKDPARLDNGGIATFKLNQMKATIEKLQEEFSVKEAEIKIETKLLQSANKYASREAQAKINKYEARLSEIRKEIRDEVEDLE